MDTAHSNRPERGPNGLGSRQGCAQYYSPKSALWIERGPDRGGVRIPSMQDRAQQNRWFLRRRVRGAPVGEINPYAACVGCLWACRRCLFSCRRRCGRPDPGGRRGRWWIRVVSSAGAGAEKWWRTARSSSSWICRARLGRPGWCGARRRSGGAGNRGSPVGSWIGERSADRGAAGGADGSGRAVGRHGRSGRFGRSVSKVADELDCDWHTVCDAVVAYGEALLDA